MKRGKIFISVKINILLCGSHHVEPRRFYGIYDFISICQEQKSLENMCPPVKSHQLACPTTYFVLF
jgi:hypothetical protein